MAHAKLHLASAAKSPCYSLVSHLTAAYSLPPMQFKSRALRLFAFVVPTLAMLLAPAFDAATAAAKKRTAPGSVLAPNDAKTPWLYRGSDIP